MFATIGCCILLLLVSNQIIYLPEKSDSYSLTGDLTNISLTLVGFIFTIVTVLITFKDNSNKNVNTAEETVFKRFFDTPYYFETIKHLKNCIKSISFIAVIGLTLKIFLTDSNRCFLFYFNVFGLIIIMLTIYRCLLIFSKILELQKAG